MIKNIATCKYFCEKNRYYKTVVLWQCIKLTVTATGNFFPYQSLAMPTIMKLSINRNTRGIITPKMSSIADIVTTETAASITIG